MRKIITLLSCCATMTMCSTLAADIVEFVPPNDPNGMVFSTDSNDGYSSGRGLVFTMTEDNKIDSIGIFHDLTGVELFWSVAETEFFSGDINEINTLASGSLNVTTNGLEWIDIGVGSLTFESGKNYHIEFRHDGIGNQNFFYNNENVPWTQSPFTNLDGTLGDNTSNFVLPAIRVNKGAVIPEPASTAVLVAMGLATCMRRRK